MTLDEARAQLDLAWADYHAMVEAAPNPRDFDGTTQWADFDRAHTEWLDSCDRLKSRVVDARLAYANLWKEQA